MNNIKKFRGKKQLSQKDLADMLGVSRTTIISAENTPGYCLSEENARKLADIFGCSVFEFVDIMELLPYKPTKTDEETIRRQVNEWFEKVDR
jgi:DNA-binding XRE family transcriptional regulator